MLQVVELLEVFLPLGHCGSGNPLLLHCGSGNTFLLHCGSGKRNIQKITYLQHFTVLQNLDSLPSLDLTGKLTCDSHNLSSHPISVRLKSTTDVQHKLRDTTQTQPRGLRTMPKAQPRGLSSTIEVKWKCAPKAQPRGVRSPPDRDKSASTSPTTSRLRFTPLKLRNEKEVALQPAPYNKSSERLTIAHCMSGPIIPSISVLRSSLSTQEVREERSPIVHLKVCRDLLLQPPVRRTSPTSFPSPRNGPKSCSRDEKKKLPHKKYPIRVEEPKLPHKK